LKIVLQSIQNILNIESKLIVNKILTYLDDQFTKSFRRVELEILRFQNVIAILKFSNQRRIPFIPKSKTIIRVKPIIAPKVEFCVSFPL